MKRVLAIVTVMVMAIGVVAGAGAQPAPETGSITIYKVDQDEQPRAGACFNLGGVNTAESGANCTDETGMLVIDDLPVPGLYQVVEESAPPGCTAGQVPSSVELTEDNPDAFVAVTNACESVEPTTGSITVFKEDQTGGALPGACFNLGSVDTLTAAQSGANCTNEDGVLVIDGLEVPGSYQLIEESVPQSCHVTEMPGVVTLTAETPHQVVTVVNHCASQEPDTGSITISKVDQHERPLAGACFNLGSVDTLTAAQSDANCTDENGVLVIDGLPIPGAYQLVEESAPHGCTVSQMPGPIELTVENLHQSVTIVNTCDTPEEPTETATATGTPDPDKTPKPGKTPRTEKTATVAQLPSTGSGGSGSSGGTMTALLAAASVMLAAGAYLTRRIQRA